MSPYDSYIICTAPRCGSTMLCKLLTDTCVAGNPESLFHRASIAEWRAGLGLPKSDDRDKSMVLRDTLDQARLAGKGGTPLFGLRLMRHSVDFLFQQLATLYPAPPTELCKINAAFGKTLFVHLTRTDKVAQAVSVVRAEQSGLWHKAPDGTEIERTTPHQEPTYDAKAIADHVRAFQDYDHQWRQWFSDQGIVPHQVVYDDLSADPHSCLTAILTALDLDTKHAKGIAPRTARLADATSLAWIHRFKADHAHA